MHLKKMVILLLAAMLLLLPLTGVADEVALRGYVKGNGWQFVNLGEYPYEKDGTPAPVMWRILDITDGKALLLTEKIIDAQQVIFETDKKKIEKKDYRRISSFTESDLYTWLNTECLDTLMEKEPLRSALIAEPDGAKLFILDMMEFLNPQYGFSATRWDNQPSRQAQGTPYAISQRGLYKDGGTGNSSYWFAEVRDPEGIHLGLMGFNGHMSWGAYTRTNVGLRVSVRLDLSQVEVSGGEGTRNSPFVLVPKGGVSDEESAAAPDAQ